MLKGENLKDKKRSESKRSMSGISSPPLSMVVLVQLFAVSSDTMLQRAFRVEYQGSSRRSILAATIGAAVVTALAILMFQYGLPLKLTSKCFEDEGLNNCCDYYHEDDARDHDEFDPPRCGLGGPDVSQGVTTAFETLYLYPLLLLNGLTAVLYHVAEVIILKHSIGQVLKVNACLCSTFLIPPIVRILVPFDNVEPIPPLLVCLAAVGATLTALSPVQWKYMFSCFRSSSTTTVQDKFLLARNEEEIRPIMMEKEKKKQETSSSSSSSLAAAFALSIAVATMLFSSALWASFQRYAQNECGVNHTGYVAVDQVVGGVYILVYVASISSEPLKGILLWKEDVVSGESFKDALSNTLKQSTSNGYRGLILIVLAKLFATLRLVGQFYLLVKYNPALVMLEMNITRLLISWIATLVMVILVPSVLNISEMERERALDTWMLLLKFAGSSILIGLLAVANSM